MALLYLTYPLSPAWFVGNRIREAMRTDDFEPVSAARCVSIAPSLTMRESTDLIGHAEAILENVQTNVLSGPVPV